MRRCRTRSIARELVAIAGIVAAITTATVPLHGQRSTADHPPTLANGSLAGADTFAFYCAPCHGKDGKGEGPVAPALKTPPADLTTLARRNGGVFPRDRVRAFVTSGERAVVSHGSADMPVWGPTFRALESSEAVVKVRLLNVIAYLESIQQ
jgi:mono/diheme cytochrome c family protein